MFQATAYWQAAENCFKWSPQDIIEDVALWLDASDANTFTLSGQEVLVWGDKSPNQNDAVSLGAFNPEYYPAQRNGRGVVFWNKMLGTMYMKGGPLGISGADPRTYIIVNNTSSDGGSSPWNSRIFYHGLRSAGEYNRFYSTANTGQHRWFLGLGDSQIATSTTGGANVNAYRGWGLAADTDGWNFSRDGTIYLSGDQIVNTTDDSYQLGENSASSTYRNAGYMCEIIVFSRILTADEWFLLNKYLACKWDLPTLINNPYLDIPCCI